MIILGGSDRRPGTLPAGRADLHALGTYKGHAIQLAGRPLIRHLVERVRAAPGFGPIGVAGPARAYGGLDLGVELIDTDGTIADNLRAALAHHAARAPGPPGPLALLACDVLPTPRELGELHELYARHAPCALWLPFVREPVDPGELGAFAWKPRYAIAPAAGIAPVRILPGHLAILEPTALRLPLLLRLLHAAYRSRNRGIGARRAAMLRAVLGALVARDALGLGRLRAPTLTVRVVGAGLSLARRLRAGNLDNGELERLVERILVRRGAPADRRRVLLPHTDVISLAEDIDTEEEARQVGGDLAVPRAEAE
jgi:hypothetical protein